MQIFFLVGSGFPGQTFTGELSGMGSTGVLRQVVLILSVFSIIILVWLEKVLT